MAARTTVMNPRKAKRLDAARVRADFPILARKIHGRRLAYLDNGATTQKPKAVLDAMARHYRRSNANVHRAVYTLSEEATRAYDEARRKVAAFLGAQGMEEIVFTKNATESLNLLAHSLGRTLKPGDEILLTQMEHHSNIVPWQLAAKRTGAVVKYIPLTRDFRLDMAAARRLITKRTRIVSVAHHSNVLGTINDVKTLAAWAHAAGALLVVDGAQSAPHTPVDVRRLECDFFACSGHKMYGPTGIGVLYGKRALLEKMEPFLGGGDMISEVTFEGAKWNDLPWKFEAGTPPIAEAIGLGAAVGYLAGLGMAAIEAHEAGLVSYALTRLGALRGITIFGPKADRGSAISFNVKGIHPHDVSTVLDRFGVAVRGGHHCAMPLMGVLGVPATCRASVGLYNTKADIDALAAGLKEAQRIFRT